MGLSLEEALSQSRSILKSKSASGPRGFLLDEKLHGGQFPNTAGRDDIKRQQMRPRARLGEPFPFWDSKETV